MVDGTGMALAYASSGIPSFWPKKRVPRVAEKPTYQWTCPGCNTALELEDRILRCPQCGYRITGRGIDIVVLALMMGIFAGLNEFWLGLWVFLGALTVMGLKEMKPVKMKQKHSWNQASEQNQLLE
jgi:DNA-directed RNA polymerase subunit RPC12/RpoP